MEEESKGFVSGMIEDIKSNPYFSAGFGLIITGAAMTTMRKGLVHADAFARKRMLVSVEMQSRDKSYNWYLKWMEKRVKRTQHMSINTRYQRRDNGTVETKFDFLPSVGTHYFVYKGRWIRVERQREKKVVDYNSGSMFESLTLTTIGRSKQVLVDMIEEAKVMALKEEEGTTILYTAFGPEWRQFGFPRERRPFDSVILNRGLADSLHHDVSDFLNNAEWYRKRGIPYRRGYLLHGPPGCGKSSFIQALAGRLEYNICILSLSDRGLTDDRLNYLLVVAPQRSIILLEDIDAAFGDNQRSVNTSYQNQLTFSGVLNALDGVAASEARILFMTTNHIDRLDPALVRPGRVDRIEYVGKASPNMTKSLWDRFYPDCDPQIFHKYAEQIKPDALSMAELQGVFLLNKSDGEKALKDVIDTIKEKEKEAQFHN